MKNKAEITIRKYLPSLEVRRRKLQLKNIPTAYRGLYDFEELEIYRQPFLLITVKDKSLGPKDFKKHSKRLKESIAYPQVWFLKELHPHKVRRMIENELNFIIEHKQVHLPSVNTSIKAEPEKVKRPVKLISLSINLIIREILIGDLSGKSKVEIAKIFNTSKMTVGRAIEPLLMADLCEERKVGVAKPINFKSRNDLWKFLKEKIKTPVKEDIYLKRTPSGMPYSGITALSKQSMLAEDPIPTFAVEKKEFYKKNKNIHLVLEDDAQAKIELWDRPPILPQDGCINVIDIYLILKDSSDERVQIELENLLKKNKLEMEKP